MEPFALLRLPAAGGVETISVSEEVPEHQLAALLHTDVTERLRMPDVPDGLLRSDAVLCYFIDARGGDRALPVNIAGTCFYHTGCPIYGDLLLAVCSQDSENAVVRGFSQQELVAMQTWLMQQLPAYLTES